MSTMNSDYISEMIDWWWSKLPDHQLIMKSDAAQLTFEPPHYPGLEQNKIPRWHTTNNTANEAKPLFLNY